MENRSFYKGSIKTIKDYIPAKIDPFIPVTIDGLNRNQIRNLLYGYICQIMHDDTYIHKVQLYEIGETYEYDYMMRIEEIPDTRRTIGRCIRCRCQDDHVFDYIW